MFWSITGTVISSCGIVLSVVIYKRTKKISDDLTTHAKNKAFAKVRGEIIQNLIQSKNVLSPLKGEDQFYILDKTNKLDGILAKILVQDITLTDKDKKKIDNLRTCLREYTSHQNEDYYFRHIAQDLNDILAKLEGEEGYDNER